MINRLKIIIAATLSVFVMLPVAVHAVNVVAPGCEGITDSAVCKDAESGQTSNPLFGPDGILTTAIKLLSFVAGIIAVIILIVTGIRFATSQGNPQTIGELRGSIIYVAVGLAVTVVSQAIVQLVLDKL